MCTRAGADGYLAHTEEGSRDMEHVGVGKGRGCSWRAEGEGRDEARDGSRGPTRQCLPGHSKDFDVYIKNRQKLLGGFPQGERW